MRYAQLKITQIAQPVLRSCQAISIRFAYYGGTLSGSESPGIEIALVDCFFGILLEDNNIFEVEEKLIYTRYIHPKAWVSEL